MKIIRTHFKLMAIWVVTLVVSFTVPDMEHLWMIAFMILVMAIALQHQFDQSEKSHQERLRQRRQSRLDIEKELERLRDDISNGNDDA